MKACPCCGYITIDDSKEVFTDICDGCSWHDLFIHRDGYTT